MEEFKDVEVKPEETPKEGKSKGKGGQRYYKRRDKAPKKGPRVPCDKMDLEKSNDIAWLNRSVTYEGATSIPRIYQAGVNYNRPDMDFLNSTKNGTAYFQYYHFYKNRSFPIGMTFEWYPILGTATDADAPLNRCFNSMYIDMQQKTAYNLPFQMMDVAITTMAIDSISYLLGYAKKVLGMNYYVDSNYAFPRYIGEMMGVKPITYLGKMTKYIDEINILISNVNALRVPNFIDVFVRHYSTAHNLYADTLGAKAQLFNFRPMGYYKFTEGSSSEDQATLKWFDIPWNNEGYTFDDLLQLISDCLEALRNSSAISSILAALRKTYSDSKLLNIEYAKPEVTVAITDRNTNWQIENMWIIGRQPEAGTLDVTQNVTGNYLMCKPAFQTATTAPDNPAVFPLKGMLNYDTGRSAVKDIKEFNMEAHRYMVVTHASEKVGTLVYPTFGTDFITRALVTYVGADPSTGGGKYQVFPISSVMSIDSTTTLSSTGLLGVGQFAVHPRVYVGTRDTDESPIIIIGMLGDVDDWTIVDYEAHKGLIRAALQSLYIVNVKADGPGY